MSLQDSLVNAFVNILNKEKIDVIKSNDLGSYQEESSVWGKVCVALNGTYTIEKALRIKALYTSNKENIRDEVKKRLNVSSINTFMQVDEETNNLFEASAENRCSRSTQSNEKINDPFSFNNKNSKKSSDQTWFKKQCQANQAWLQDDSSSEDEQCNSHYHRNQYQNNNGQYRHNAFSSNTQSNIQNQYGLNQRFPGIRQEIQNRIMRLCETVGCNGHGSNNLNCKLHFSTKNCTILKEKDKRYGLCQICASEGKEKWVKKKDGYASHISKYHMNE